MTKLLIGQCACSGLHSSHLPSVKQSAHLLPGLPVGRSVLGVSTRMRPFTTVLLMASKELQKAVYTPQQPSHWIQNRRPHLLPGLPVGRSVLGVSTRMRPFTTVLLMASKELQKAVYTPQQPSHWIQNRRPHLLPGRPVGRSVPGVSTRMRPFTTVLLMGNPSLKSASRSTTAPRSSLWRSYKGRWVTLCRQQKALVQACRELMSTTCQAMATTCQSLAWFTASAHRLPGD